MNQQEHLSIHAEGVLTKMMETEKRIENIMAAILWLPLLN